MTIATATLYMDSQSQMVFNKKKGKKKNKINVQKVRCKVVKSIN